MRTVAGMSGAAVSSLALVLTGCMRGDAEPERVGKGEQLFRDAGCFNCHVYDGMGSANVGAPELTCEGDRGRGVAWLTRYIENPRAFGNEIMPSFEELGRENVREIARFLQGSTC